MLDQSLRRWSNIEPTLKKCTVFERKSSWPAYTKHLYTIYTTSAQRLRRWFNIVLSHTDVLCLQANDQLRTRDKGFSFDGIINS